MSMAYIRECYLVPAKRGARIRYTGCGSDRTGTIVGSRDQYLRIRFDDEPNRIDTAHPTWEIQYLGSNQ